LPETKVIGVVGSEWAGVRGEGMYVKVGLTERRRLSFEQFNPRAPLTQKNDSKEMVDGTPNAVALEPVTKEM
jgi:hypothetical protein